MREWQFEQVTSNSCDIGDPPIYLVLLEEYTDTDYTPNDVFWLHWAQVDRLPGNLKAIFP